MNTNEKTALVTGGAQGIGKSTVLMLANQGYDVIVADLNGAMAGRVAQEARAFDVKSESYQLDVSNIDQINSLIEYSTINFNGIDVFFNNAGITKHISFFDIIEDDWDKINSVNAKGAFFCMQKVSQLMVKQGRGGRIVNAGSIAGKGYRRASNAAYAASKGSVIAMTHIASDYLSTYDINVNAVCPGMVRTDMLTSIVTIRAEEMGDSINDVQKHIESEIPLGRINEPEDVAALAVFLMGPGSRNITGQAFNVDGGMIMH
jgi:meso-butanediol dehydrogenase/(S,S)-butanediol dehydrogenase/diacetyl reductase